MVGLIGGLPRNPFSPAFIRDFGRGSLITRPNSRDSAKAFLELGFNNAIFGVGRDGTRYHLLRIADFAPIDGGTVNFALLADAGLGWISVSTILDMIGNDIIDVRYLGNKVALYDTRLAQRYPSSTLSIGLATSPGGTPDTVPLDRFVIGNNGLLVPATFGNLSTLGFSDAELRVRTFRHLGWTGASVVTQARNIGGWGTDGGTSVMADQTNSPDGTLTAELVTETAVTGTHNRYHIPAGARPTAGVSTWGCEIHLKQTSPAGVNKLRFQLQDGTGAKWARTVLDLRGMGSFDAIATSGFTSPTVEIEPVNNLWKRVRIVATTDADSTGIGILISLADDTGAISYLGTAGRGLYVTDAAIRPAGEIWIKDGYIRSAQSRVAELSTIHAAAPVGSEMWAIDGRNAGEGVGAGTGCPVWKRAAGWRMADGSAVAA